MNKIARIDEIKQKRKNMQNKLNYFEKEINNLYQLYCETIMEEILVLNMGKPVTQDDINRTYLPYIHKLKQTFDYHIKSLKKEPKNNQRIQNYIDYLEKIEQNVSDKFDSKMHSIMIFTILFSYLDEKIIVEDVSKFEEIVLCLLNSDIPIDEYSSSVLFMIDKKIIEKTECMNLDSRTKVALFTNYLLALKNGYTVEDCLQNLDSWGNDTNEIFPPLLSIEIIHNELFEVLSELNRDIFQSFFSKEDMKTLENILELKVLQGHSRKQYIYLVQHYDKCMKDIILKIKYILLISEQFLEQKEYLVLLDDDQLFTYIDDICQNQIGNLQDCIIK